jgi:hypothetical protein
MAAKRGSHWRSTRRRKPEQSPPRARKPAIPPEFTVRPPDKMTPGKSYVGWFCKKCRLLIAIDGSGDPPEMVILGGDYLLEAVVCPHCSTEKSYRWHNRDWQVYVPKAPS